MIKQILYLFFFTIWITIKIKLYNLLFLEEYFKLLFSSDISQSVQGLFIIRIPYCNNADIVNIIFIDYNIIF